MQRSKALQHRPYRNLPHKAVMGQSIVAMLMIAATYAGKGTSAAASVLSGSAVSLIPTLYFAYRFLRPRGSRQARQHVSNLYRAQVGKMVLTMALFAIVFVKWPPSHPVLFFFAYAVTTYVPWLAGWRVRRDHPHRS